MIYCLMILVSLNCFIMNVDNSLTTKVPHDIKTSKFICNAWWRTLAVNELKKLLPFHYDVIYIIHISLNLIGVCCLFWCSSLLSIAFPEKEVQRFTKITYWHHHHPSNLYEFNQCFLIFMLSSFGNRSSCQHADNTFLQSHVTK